MPGKKLACLLCLASQNSANHSEKAAPCCPGKAGCWAASMMSPSIEKQRANGRAYPSIVLTVVNPLELLECTDFGNATEQILPCRGSPSQIDSTGTFAETSPLTLPQQQPQLAEQVGVSWH